MPDASESKVINRKFLFNVRTLLPTNSLQVINTVKPQFFQLEIQKALIVRKNKQALTQNKFIEMNEQMLQLITNSNHVSTGKSRSLFPPTPLATRGKALSLLNTVTYKRSRAEFTADPS